ncbi:FAD-binding protein [Acidisphaera sp. S103]|uniref:FAD-dependent oxidoreductase n=1 Tax=Acidisphaera sp. S103 TaxID=1747223 RepID=UPI00131B964D|nr:FAD-binding protein [Acidisphaera sp. S103]
MAGDFDTDVLVLGGGPAGTWAALTAASGGARVVLADKGFCGSSGATAAAGTGVWYVPPDPAKRQAAMDSRDTLGGHLADPAWMARVLDRTWHGVNEIAAWGYPFPLDQDGAPRRNSLQGPEYMRLMRRRVKGAGVRIMDQAPALELLVDEHGAVAGAAGVYRQKDAAWTGRAKAVVIATGGCAFLSNGLGCNVLTGDGYLMAAEVGAEFSGMEFSNAYAIAPAFASVTKTLFYNWATFTAPSGAAIPGASSKGGRSVIARWLQRGAVYAQIDKADGATQATMRVAQPNFFLPFDRAGIDPFTQRFPVTLRLEGTVRGTGGLRIIDESCATSVPGLYAAGDAATRELICGGFTGGGSHNAAWAMSSGHWAGRGAADHARASGPVTRRAVHRSGGAALVGGGGFAMDPQALVRVVQSQVFPYETNYFRTGDRLEKALTVLDDHWHEARRASPAARSEASKAREAVAMLATARWMYRSALARSETRGMHRRLDHTGTDPTQRHAFASGGLDKVWVRPLPPVERAEQGLAA